MSAQFRDSKGINIPAIVPEKGYPKLIRTTNGTDTLILLITNEIGIVLEVGIGRYKQGELRCDWCLDGMNSEVIKEYV